MKIPDEDDKCDKENVASHETVDRRRPARTLICWQVSTDEFQPASATFGTARKKKSIIERGVRNQNMGMVMGNGHKIVKIWSYYKITYGGQNGNRQSHNSKLLSMPEIDADALTWVLLF